MNDMIEKVKQGLDRCKHGDGKYCFVCPYAKENKKPFPPTCNKELCHDAMSVIEELQAEIERLKNAMVETGSIHCPCSPDCGDDCEKCVDSAIEETLKAKPPKSAWIHRADMDYKDKNGVVHFHGMCKNCGFIHDFNDGHTGQYKFCPVCGSKNEQWKDGVPDGNKS